MFPVLIFIAVHWYLAAFCQTFFLHRYGAHRMFTMSRGWERFFYVLTYLCQGTSYLNPRAYAVLHHLHHAYSDTEKDPHSPVFFRTPVGMMMKTLRVYLDIFSKKARIPEHFDRDYPEWPAFDRIADFSPLRILFAALYASVYVAFQAPAWMYVFLPVNLFMGPIHGAIVNWCGHKYGYANFDNGDHSKNTLPLDLIAMGELMQNNHHRNPKSAKFSVKPFEIDPVYPVIRLLDRFGVVRMAVQPR